MKTNYVVREIAAINLPSHGRHVADLDIVLYNVYLQVEIIFTKVIQDKTIRSNKCDITMIISGMFACLQFGCTVKLSRNERLNTGYNTESGTLSISPSVSHGSSTP